jgi:aminodeoxyfutalosine deaminase
MATLHSAPIVVPVSGEPIADGAVLVDGDRIAEVGPRAELAGRHRTAEEHAWTGVLTPGLVNAHSHTQYSDFEELNSLGEPFAVWIARLTEKRSTFTPEMWQRSARRGLELMLASGTTAVADIVTDPEVFEPSAQSGLIGISYLEAVFLDARTWAGGGRDRFVATLDSAPAGRTVGVSPHTPYTLATAVFADCVAVARDRGLRIHTHVAESAAEVEYVATGTGPFRDFMSGAGMAMELIRDGGCGLSPTGYLDKIGALGPDVHAAHCVHCDGADREILRARGVSVALCVRSNRILQAGEPPVAAYLDEGSPFGIGTDSLASSPSLDLLEEAAALRDLARDQGYRGDDLDRRIFEAATLGGADAMGLADVGRIEPGARADLAVFSLPGLEKAGSVYSALLDAAADQVHRCAATVLGGAIVHRA